MARLLITGGTGSFGGAVTRKFLNDSSISEIIIFSRDEKKQHEMRYAYESKKISYIIGDIRDRDAVVHATREVDYIFHAAALKHVPTGEYFPMEMVRTNVLGTENVAYAAEINNVKKVVFLSTDKAAYPINAMGMTKAISEKIIGARSRESKRTIFSIVRYGNVMASRGSVIPLFVDRIKQGLSLTVTDPLMTRFLMSLEDSVDLVERAISSAGPGDLLIKKAPAATIKDLAEALLSIFNTKGLIEIVGVRAGEKKHETLVTGAELARAKDFGEYYCVQDIAMYKYQDFYREGVITQVTDDYTSENTHRLSVPEIKTLLLKLEFIQKEISC